MVVLGRAVIGMVPSVSLDAIIGEIIGSIYEHEPIKTKSSPCSGEGRPSPMIPSAQ